MLKTLTLELQKALLECVDLPADRKIEALAANYSLFLSLYFFGSNTVPLLDKEFVYARHRFDSTE